MYLHKIHAAPAASLHIQLEKHCISVYTKIKAIPKEVIVWKLPDLIAPTANEILSHDQPVGGIRLIPLCEFVHTATVSI